MRLPALFVAALLAACSSAPAERPDLDIETVAPPDTSAETDTVASVDTPADPGSGPVDPALLNGTVPSEMLPAPEFLAHNFDNAVRGRDALIGHPTVMWFFPATGTPG